MISSARIVPLLLFGLMILPVLSADLPARPRIGVNPFAGEAVSSEERRALTLRLQDELFKSGAYQLVEQAEMRKIMEEHGLAQAGCTDLGCTIEMVKLAGAQKLLMPSIARIGEVTTLTLRLVDVATGKIERLATLDTKRPMAKILQKEVPRLAARLTGKASPGNAVYQFDPALKRKPVAVLDIAGFGIDKNEAKGLTNRLRTELFNTGVFEVMEREQMEDILKEQGFQQTGAITDENSLVQAGQLIGVQYMVGGAVSRISDLYSVSSRLIEVKSGKIVRTASADVKGDLERVLKETMNDMARSISGLEIVKRTDTKALAWLGGAALLAVAGGGFFVKGYGEYGQYKDERFDLSRLRSYKNASKRDFYIGYAFLGAAAAGASASLYFRISDKIKLKVNAFVEP